MVLVAGGYGIWRMQLTTPPTDEQIAAEDNAAAAPIANNAAAAPAPVTGPVVMTAVDDVWIRIYQADGTRLYEGTLKRGDSYTVPDTARDPMILTGRPDALSVTVGGQAMPPLGPAERTISDVPVSATALLARAKQPIAPEDNAAAPVEAGNAAAPAAGGIVPPPGAPVPPRRSNRTPRPANSQAPAPGAAENAATP